MKDIFKTGGYLQVELKNFEYRKEQEDLSSFIYEQLQKEKHNIIEAGTGTGKSIAYLIPAIKYSIENNKKVIISTETKALQKQLMDKDIPIAENIFSKYYDTEFKYSLCLGSRNYVCRRKFESLLLKGRFTKPELKSIHKLEDLFRDKKIFTRFDLKVSNSLWNDISRDPDTCNYFKCPFVSKCTYQNARKEWSDSNLLVVNHYLFFTNIASGKTYLPDCDIAIIDEAHSIEDIASSQLGFSLNNDFLLEIIDRLYRKNRKNNLINNISVPSLMKKSVKKINEIISEGGIFFGKMRDILGNAGYIRIFENLTEGKILAQCLQDLKEILTDAEGDFQEEFLNMEFETARSHLSIYTENLKNFIYQNFNDFVYWIEKRDKELLDDIFLKAQPVDISRIMQNEVYSHYESVSFISATLSVKNQFKYIAGRFGLKDYTGIIFDSSFNYKDQMIMYIGNKIAQPGDDNFNAHAKIAIREIINHLNGNCLLLFTSYKMLRDIKELLIDEIDYPIYSQDEYTSTEAVELYCKDNNAILMGSHSFWQGIDLPGDLLRGVIMMRLPFSVPDTPLFQAKIEKIKAKGGNAFISLQVPEAAIKFKQGFGRLIRSQNDKGIVAVLDSRIYSKSYGKEFLNSIPECSIVYKINDLKYMYMKIMKQL